MSKFIVSGLRLSSKQSSLLYLCYFSMDQSLQQSKETTIPREHKLDMKETQWWSCSVLSLSFSPPMFPLWSTRYCFSSTRRKREAETWFTQYSGWLSPWLADSSGQSLSGNSQAQLKLNLKLNWSWVALFALYPATHPPTCRNSRFAAPAD